MNPGERMVTLGRRACCLMWATSCLVIFGVILAAFLLGSMDAGAAKMQFESGVSADIIQIIQALVLAFVAAPTIIREIYRIRSKPDEDETTLTVGWS